MLTSTLTPPTREHGLEEPTLDVAITRVWARVMSARDASCPWCGGRMQPRYSAGPLPVGARCHDCKASLT
jgi:tRNA(Ile2) C34 agmatinyltransferase TiaS